MQWCDNISSRYLSFWGRKCYWIVESVIEIGTNLEDLTCGAGTDQQLSWNQKASFSFVLLSLHIPRLKQIFDKIFSTCLWPTTGSSKCKTRQNIKEKSCWRKTAFFSGLGQFYNVPPMQSTNPIQFHSLTTALLQHRAWCHWPFEEKQMILLIAAILRCILLPTADNRSRSATFGFYINFLDNLRSL